MFGIEFAMAMIEASIKRNEWIATLSDEEAEIVRKEDEEYQKQRMIRDREELLHKRAVEIAAAGRPRNFFGQ